MSELDHKFINSISMKEEELMEQELKNSTARYKELIAYCRCALMEVETKFKVLNEELYLEYDRNPIENIKGRIKSLDSIIEKLKRRNLPVTVDSMEQNLNDIAGIRIICGFPSDIYNIANAFLNQDDITLIESKDYIQNPKPNGYRSLHLIVEIPIFLHDEKKPMRVEVQFRTMSMDWWASTEHKIRYKKGFEIPEGIALNLLDCAEQASILDNKMDHIRKYIEDINDVEED